MPPKRKLLVIAPPSIRSTIKIRGTFINGSCIRFDQWAKNLGVIIDDELTFKRHVDKIVKSCNMTIRKLSKIKDFLTYEQLRTAVCSYVFLTIDYCNSLLYGIHADLLDKLQSVQNSAARLVRGKSKFQGSTAEFIRKCHWLRIRERIIFSYTHNLFQSLYFG